MKTVVVLYGPKAAGKTKLARRLNDELSIDHIDPDELVLIWIAKGLKPDPEVGWLEPVLDKVISLLETSETVSVEATGAWKSDWQLADNLESTGINVLRIWLNAPEEILIERLRSRREKRFPVTEAEAKEIYKKATNEAMNRSFVLKICTKDGTYVNKTVNTIRNIINER